MLFIGNTLHTYLFASYVDQTLIEKVDRVELCIRTGEDLERAFCLSATQKLKWASLSLRNFTSALPATFDSDTQIMPYLEEVSAWRVPMTSFPMPPRVARLRIMGCQMLENIPVSLTSLSCLAELVVRSCRLSAFTAVLPHGLRRLELSSMPRLRTLGDLSPLRGLQSLVLRGLGIAQLNGLPSSVETLSLSRCRHLKDFSAVSSLLQLRDLDLSRTSFQNLDFVPGSVARLHLSGCRSPVLDDGTLDLSQLLHLAEVYLDDTSIPLLPLLPASVRIVHADACSFMTSLGPAIKSLPILEDLSVAATPVASVAGLLPGCIKGLYASGCDELEVLGDISFLAIQELDISSSRVSTIGRLPSSIGLLRLRSCRLLRELDSSITQCPLTMLELSDNGIETLPTLPASISWLRIEKCPCIRQLPGLPSCRRLEHLALHLTGVAGLPPLPASLVHIELVDNPLLLDIPSDFSSLPALRHLAIRGSLLTAVTALPDDLIHIDLSSNANLTSICDLSLSSKLKTLNVAATPLLRLPDLPPSIQQIDLIDCPQLHLENLSSLPNLVVLSQGPSMPPDDSLSSGSSPLS